MADASAGEPLEYRHGVALWSAQSVKGTPVTPASSLGLCTIGQPKQSANQRFRSPGSPNIKARKGGMLQSPFDIQIAAVQAGTKTFLLKALRSGGVLPLVTLGFGYQDDVGTPNRHADQIQDAKIGQLSLSLDASSGHGPLSAQVSGIGGLITALTSLAPAHLTTAPYFSYEGAFTIEGSARPLRSLQFTVNHNLVAKPVIPGTTPASFQRGWTHLNERDETITFEISSWGRPTENPLANTITEYDGVLTLTNLDDASTLVLSMTDMDFDEVDRGVGEQGIFWTIRGECKTWNLA